MRRFQLTVERAPGALERVLGVARRRGLGVESLDVKAQPEGTWKISIEAGASSNDASLALRQFAALVNVRHAALEEM